MGYRGYSEVLLAWIAEAFPLVGRPADDELLVQGDDGLCCRFLQQSLPQFQASDFPLERVHLLHMEYQASHVLGSALTAERHFRA